MKNKLIIRKDDIKFMQEAIEIAKESRRLGDYAIGTLITKNGRIVARAGNRIRTEIDSSSHSEIVAMRMLSRDLASRYLTDCTIYSTAALCPMCTTAAVWAKVSGIVYGASQKDIIEYGAKYGNDRFKWRGVNIEPEELYERYLKDANPGMKIRQVMQEECKKLFHNKP